MPNKTKSDIIKEMQDFADKTFEKYDTGVFTPEQNHLMDDLLSEIIVHFQTTDMKPSDVLVVIDQLRNYIKEFIDVIGDDNDAIGDEND